MKQRILVLILITLFSCSCTKVNSELEKDFFESSDSKPIIPQKLSNGDFVCLNVNHQLGCIVSKDLIEKNIKVSSSNSGGALYFYAIINDEIEIVHQIELISKELITSNLADGFVGGTELIASKQNVIVTVYKADIGMMNNENIEIYQRDFQDYDYDGNIRSVFFYNP